MNTKSYLLLFAFLLLAPLSACSPAPTAVPTAAPPTATPPPPTLAAKPATATLQPTPIPPSPTTTSKPPTLTPKPMARPGSDNEYFYLSAYDPTTKRLIMANVFSPDVWAYDFADKQWTRLPDYPAIAISNVVYEPKARRVIAYSMLTGQTMAYDPTQNRWQELSTGPIDQISGGVSPMAYDSKTGKIFMLSKNPADAHKSDIWTFDDGSNTWSQMKPAANQPDNINLVMVYDAKSDRMILWEGDPSPCVWAYDPNNNTWEENPDTTGPTKREGDLDSSLYVPDLDRVFFYYGDQFYTYNYNTKTWEKAKGELKPGLRFVPSLVYDPDARRIVLYGGATNGLFLHDMWFYDPRSGVWTEEKQT